ncbi:MAG: TonB-dependent receptor [Bacteroidales bacterium]|nr:TonB-dependent receptor [Bacteroidales bacterium]
MKKLITQFLRLFALLICSFTMLGASAQNVVVSGTVIDEQDEPLIGATVAVKGTANAAATNIDGEFSLTVSNANVQLTVSYVGYRPLTVDLNGRTNVTVKLTPDDTYLDEVVVVGYGRQKKVHLTGAVSAVSGAELTKAPMQNVSNLLTGKVAGLTSIQSSGQPGADGTSIYVRGNNGGTGGFGANPPLVLVDGIERDMNLVNPNDIESISVLKDAAAAIYGIKGMNGVILITTKSGEGAPKISYGASFSAVRNTAFPKFLNAEEFMYYKNKALIMDGFEPLYTADIQQKVFANDPDSPWGETDWFDEIFRTGFTQQHNVSASGSSERVKYYTSLGYMGQEGTIKKTDYSRINARANLDIKVAKDLTFAITMSGVKTQRRAPRADSFNKQGEINVVRQAANTAPIIKKEWNGYTLAWKEGSSMNVNPVAALEQTGEYRSDAWVFNSTYKLAYDFSNLWAPLKGLNVDVFFAYDYQHTQTSQFQKGYELLAFDNSTLESKVETSYGIGLDRYYDRIGENNWRWQLRPTVSYARDFGKHSVNFLFVYEKSRWYKDMLYAAARGFISDEPIDINLGTNFKDNVPQQQGSHQNYGMASYAFRLNYAFDDKYLLEVAVRRDGSYVFAPENRWGTFPSVSAGWVISREGFMKDIQWIDFLKLRASYGELGDDGGASRAFQYNHTFKNSSDSYLLGGSPITQYYVDPVYTFRSLEWAHAYNYNVGIDASLFRNKLNAEIDVFYKRTDGILEATSAAYPSSLGGYYPAYLNSGSMDNRGVEVTLTHTNQITKDFSYRLRGSVSFARNKVLKKKVTDSEPYARQQLGRPYGSIFGFKTLGLFQSMEEIADYPKAPSGETLPGDIKYVDVNGDGIISREFDYVKIGYGRIPEYNFSFNIDLNYKNFYLTTLWQGVAHCDYQLQGVYDSGTTASTVYTSSFGTGNSPKYLIEGAWTPENPNAKYPRLSTVPRFNNAWVSDWWIVNGNYLRLKNIQIGYNFPTHLLKKTPFSMINLYLAGTNIWTITDFKYVDPESPSVSNGFYPQQATYTFGLNVAF